MDLPGSILSGSGTPGALGDTKVARGRSQRRLGVPSGGPKPWKNVGKTRFFAKNITNYDFEFNARTSINRASHAGKTAIFIYDFPGPSRVVLLNNCNCNCKVCVFHVNNESNSGALGPGTPDKNLPKPVPYKGNYGIFFKCSFKIHVNNESNSGARGPGTPDKNLPKHVPYRGKFRYFFVFLF